MKTDVENFVENQHKTKRPEFSGLFICAFQKLQLGITVAVDDGVDFAALLAEGAVVAAVVFVFWDILSVKEAVYRYVLHAVHIAEQSADAGRLAAVVPDAVEGPVHRFAGGNRRYQQKDVFVPDLFLNVVSENHLVKGVYFRGNNRDVLAGIDKSKS